MYSIMTRFTTIPLILLLIPATQASLLRASHERDLLSMNLGCPYKECYPISYFSLDALETATCQDSSDCEYGFPCVYYEGKFQCGNHVSNPCSLDCVSGQAQRERRCCTDSFTRRSGAKTSRRALPLPTC